MVKKAERKSITRQEVFEAAQGLIVKGYTPTQDNVRHFLGRGSRGTIHKYLKAWKEACFKQGGKRINLEVTEHSQKLLEENHRLRQQLDKQSEHNKTLAHDLLTIERELAQLKEQYEIQQQVMTSLEEIQETLAHENGRLQSVYEAVCQERETAIQKVLEDKNQWIEKLRQELKETHEENLSQTREWSYRQEDALMQEKVKNLNSQEQIKTLKQELKQMALELAQAKNAVEPLKREVTRQRKIIEEHIDIHALIEIEKKSAGENRGVGKGE